MLTCIPRILHCGHCLQCKKRGKASQKLELFELPEVIMINLKRTPETLNESGLVDVMRVSSGGAGTNGLRPSLMIGPGTNRLRPSPCPLTDQQVSALPVSPGSLLPPPQGP